MSYEERAKKLERRLKNTGLEYTFDHQAQAVTIKAFDKVDSALFAGLERKEFIEARPIIHEKFDKAGMELVFNI